MKKTKTYAEKRFFHWIEDDKSVSLRNRSGSYGGGSEVLIIEYRDEDPTEEEADHP